MATTTITKADLMSLAKSTNPAERQRAQEIYAAWVKAAPQLDSRDRLNTTERMILLQMLNSKPKPRR
jgi:hypothetical protein